MTRRPYTLAPGTEQTHVYTDTAHKSRWLTYERFSGARVCVCVRLFMCACECLSMRVLGRANSVCACMRRSCQPYNCFGALWGKQLEKDTSKTNVSPNMWDCGAYGTLSRTQHAHGFYKNIFVWLSRLHTQHYRLFVVWYDDMLRMYSNIYRSRPISRNYRSCHIRFLKYSRWECVAFKYPTLHPLYFLS